MQCLPIHPSPCHPLFPLSTALQCTLSYHIRKSLPAALQSHDSLFTALTVHPSLLPAAASFSSSLAWLPFAFPPLHTYSFLFLLSHALQCASLSLLLLVVALAPSATPAAKVRHTRTFNRTHTSKSAHKHTQPLTNAFACTHACALSRTYARTRPHALTHTLTAPHATAPPSAAGPLHFPARTMECGNSRSAIQAL